MKRRESREIAFTLLFEWDFNGEPVDVIIRQASEVRGEKVDTFTRELVQKTTENIDQIDSLIEQYSQNWKISRISRVTLAAIRLAFCELLFFDKIPEGATINEAVELVKKYGTDDESSYLNGILGGYVRGSASKGEDG